jgi:hypothetical protein
MCKLVTPDAVMVGRCAVSALALAAALAAGPASAADFFFTTGAADQRLGSLSQPSGPAPQENVRPGFETADDFALTRSTTLTHATFIGLVAPGTKLSDIKNVETEFYHFLPAGQDTGGLVPTRVNSPTDFEIADATRDGADGSLSFTMTVLDPNFTVGNTVSALKSGATSVLTATGGNGAFTGEEIEFDVTFTNGVELDPNHLFFRPQVDVADGGQFFWLSAARPAGAQVAPGITDLQSWVRNDSLAPNWERVGNDVIGAGSFNMAFSLTGNAVPEPASWAMMIMGFGLAGATLRARRRLSAQAA